MTNKPGNAWGGLRHFQDLYNEKILHYINLYEFLCPDACQAGILFAVSYKF